ncbi:ragulator complex protein LAMTOR1-like isoform X2 [Uloborus diversus]|uniref:ragulator complex protein LAMTOR1-like isoform X2 n=1 Tax=Uloborus diversus TaxID=327109 RepID=UPI00240A9BB3|nr:ragulator complex protein LAMTOR1-like isoform X2 [Uloborus diversus]XP_054714038.1 ragulator complex protein LAMTOR1-like isoform X2 [Uloborus diversus]
MVISMGNMGCCFSCFNTNENKSQSGEPNERTTLLGNPVSNNSSRPLFSQDFSDVVSGQLGDEQAALNKILHQTAVDIIDVSAIPTHIEQKDFIDRSKLYQKKILTLHLFHRKNDKHLLKDLPMPEKILSEPPLLLADFRMMEEIFKDVEEALKAVEIEPQGDLVSKFGLS